MAIIPSECHSVRAETGTAIPVMTAVITKHAETVIRSETAASAAVAASATTTAWISAAGDVAGSRPAAKTRSDPNSGGPVLLSKPYPTVSQDMIDVLIVASPCSLC